MFNTSFFHTERSPDHNQRKGLARHPARKTKMNFSSVTQSMYGIRRRGASCVRQMNGEIAKRSLCEGAAVSGSVGGLGNDEEVGR